MIQVNRIYLIFNRLVTKKFLVDTSEKMKCTENEKAAREYRTAFQYGFSILRRINNVGLLRWLSDTSH